MEIGAVDQVESSHDWGVSPPRHPKPKTPRMVSESSNRNHVILTTGHDHEKNVCLELVHTCQSYRY